MKLPGISRAKETIEARVIQPITSAIIIAVTAIVVACIALLMSVGAINAH